MKKFSQYSLELNLRVNRILSNKKENPRADTSSIEAEIGQMIYELYGLIEEEIGIVEGGVK
ncbi:hypothetical protein [uncultured Roseivirga sp.]|uniref:hypothetical protein n=1 Tax=uncultured Roseivirga sp. TaxID=543088 RepID=UPI000D7B652D|nr:hypothetical protein [uncultured Roseivirga sp.]PWL30744.1 MAG: hypothetical protein DCO95_04505 [Roseivirga sp. XM-24bin3]